MARFFVQYRHIIIFTVVLVVVFWLIYELRSVLLPFIVGLILAYLLFPVVLWTERHLPGRGRWMRVKRILIILLIYLIALGVIALVGYLTIPEIVRSVTSLVNSLPDLVPNMIQKIQDFTKAFQQHVPPEISQQVNTYLTDLLGKLGNGLQSALFGVLSSIPGTVGLVLGFASLPLFLFYLIFDAERLQKGFFSLFPPWMAVHTRNIVAILQQVLGRYIRAQLLMGLIIGVVDFTWLMILGIPFAPALAFLSGLMELVPVLGPWIGGAVGVIVTLATNPGKIVWVIVLYLVVQLLEGNLLSPRVTGGIMRIHPAIILVLIILGAHFAGFWGIVLIVPVTATLVPLYQYLLRITKEAGVETPPQP
ncbi:MAG TPA: AI-2E family transporter [Dehalococcoidales bacterium]|jgi:predicted PurR-regulated permease PerM